MMVSGFGKKTVLALPLALLALIMFISIRGGDPGPEPIGDEGNAAKKAIQAAADIAIVEGEAEARVSIRSFDAWVDVFMNASAAQRGSMRAEGLLLAERRREAMKDLIESDPEAAIDAAIPYAIRRELPPEVVARLEKIISARGDYEMLTACFGDVKPGEGMSRFAVFGEERYRAFPYGKRSEMTTKNGISLHGIAVDDAMAVVDDPIRVLSDLERADRGFGGAGIAGEINGNVYAFADEAVLDAVRASLDAGEFMLGPRSGPGYAALRTGNIAGVTLIAAAPAEEGGTAEGGDEEAPESAHTEGPKTMLYIRARFSDQAAGFIPISDTDVNTRQAACEAFWFENSYGKSSLTTTITTTVTLSNDAATSSSGGLTALLNDAKAAAVAANPAWNSTAFNFTTVLTSGGSFSYGGVAFVGGTGSHLNGSGAAYIRTASHEFGHNLGLRHAQYWRTDSPSPIGRDSIPGGYVGDATDDEHIEYGHKFSVMSAQSGTNDFNAGRGHYTNGEKVKLDWLVQGDGDWVSINSSTATPRRLYRHDVLTADFGTMTPGVARGIKINLDSGDYNTSNKRRYWLNYRRLPTNGVSETWLRRGLQIDWQRNTYGSDGSILLDMTPFSNDNPSTTGSAYTQDNSDKEDAALLIGRTHSDAVADIHITPIGQGGGNPNEWIDVIVNVGTQTGNNDPVINTYTSSATQVGTGVSVNFTAAATDVDGDTVYYGWDFGDNSVVVGSLNSTTATKNWGTAGYYPVRVTASDAKGGTDTKEIIIQVGNPATNKYAIFGRVLQGGVPVENARVNIGTTYQTWTEGDGTYALVGLPTGNRTVTAAKLGLTLTPQFTNPVALTTLDAYGRDFFADENGGGTGGLTLAVAPYEITMPLGARLGFTAQAWDASGDPVATSPAWMVSGGGTIDAGGVFEAGAVGGPYTITATDGAAMAEAQVTVANLDAVAIRAPDADASEGTLDGGLFEFHRFGSTASALSVKFSKSGTATNNTDYFGVASPVSIGIGVAAEPRALNPKEDGLTEGPETATFTLTADASYQIFEWESAATVTIADDDLSPEVAIDSPTHRGAVIPGAVGMVLESTGSDDGKPGPLTTTWSVVATPAGGMAFLDDANAEDTAVTFSGAGAYTLRATVDDGDTTGSADVVAHVGVSAPSNPTTTDEVIYYTLDEGSGTEAGDSAGGDNPGTLSGGAAWTAAIGGISGTAVALDGTNDYIDIANALEINTDTSHTKKTIALWFKADDPLAVAKQVLYEQGGSTRGLNLYLDSGRLYFGGWSNGLNGWNETYLSVPLEDTGWHHAVLVLDTTMGGGLTADGLKVYLDGAPAGAGEAAEMSAHTGSVAIGAMRNATKYHDGNGASNGDYFDGLVDEFHYFNNRVLTLDEIGGLYAFGNIGALVNAGSNQTSAPALRAALAGTSSDDGRWTSPVAHSWAVSSGPGSGVFSLPDANGIDTLGTFTAAGGYALRLTADDSQVKTFDDVIITLTGVPYYDLFMDGYPSITGPDRAHLANPDGDPWTNLEEYGLRGRPDLGDSHGEIGLSSGLVEDGGQTYFEFRYPRRRDAAVRGLGYAFEICDDLTPGTWSASGYTETGTTVIDAAFEEVTVRIDAPLGPGNLRKYGRLEIDISE